MDKINEAWQEYHGYVDLGDEEPYIPSAPPLFTRGYTDGYQQGQADLKKKIDELIDSVSGLISQEDLEDLERLHPF